MSLKYLFLTIVSVVLFACKETPLIDYKIIPHPNSIIYTNGSFSLKNDIKVYFTDEVENEADLLKEYLSLDFGVKFENVYDEKKADIIIELNKQYHSDKNDGYKLDIGSKNIVLTSNSRAGVLNAIQTLRQIIRKSDD